MPLIPMRDRLVLKEIPHDQTVSGLHIIRQEDGNDRAKAEKLVRGTIRAKVIAQGDGMLVGETGDQFENCFPKAVYKQNSIGELTFAGVIKMVLLGKTVVVSYYAGFEDEDPITAEKLIIVTPLDILAVVEGN
jgi:co-chaperonin GroES (HSP10)